jgi:hypothetical protein
VTSDIVPAVNLSEDARLAPTANIAASEIDGGAVLVDMASGQCFELNRIGLEIWHAIGRRQTLREIYDVLADRYPRAGERLMADLANLADALLAAGLVEVVPV